MPNKLWLLFLLCIHCGRIGFDVTDSPTPNNNCTSDQDCAGGRCDLSQDPPVCLQLASCGNGSLDANEGCDDGNLENSDGCNSACALETGQACSQDQDCATGQCDTSTGQCVDSQNCQGCSVNGTCFSANEAHPTNSCLLCDPSASTSDWQNATAGTPCSGGGLCDGNGVCNALSTSSLANGFLNDNDLFGNDISFFQDTMVVGAPSQSFVSNTGKAFLYQRLANGNWSMLDANPLAGGMQFLEASDGINTDLFGQSVSISGNYVAVGALFATTSVGSDRGAVYVYEKDSNNVWSEAIKLESPRPSTAQFDNFGSEVMIDGDRLFVSEPWPQGFVHYYERTAGTWTFKQSLQPNEINNNDRFGFSFAVDGDLLLVASPAFSGGGDIGIVYLYTFSNGNWTGEQELDRGSVSGDYFGISVALEGQTAVVGACQSDGSSHVGPGYVKVYNLENGIIEVATLSRGAQAVIGDGFGFSVDIRNGLIAVGSVFEDTAGFSDAGAAYMFQPFQPNNYSLSHIFLSPDASDNDAFGFACNLAGDQSVFCSAIYESSIGINQGRVYQFGY
ncbi:MAG: hypothetical protein IPJ88_05410 [Myxococcales bacterium]|nr:MAG: hypothetical protein IPJ88_05410 [Myxococcales bacterium]